MSRKSITIIVGIIFIIVGIILVYFGFAPIPSIILALGYILVGISLIPEKEKDGKKKEK